MGVVAETAMPPAPTLPNSGLEKAWALPQKRHKANISQGTLSKGTVRRHAGPFTFQT